MTTEKALQAKIATLFRSEGMLVYKFASPSHRGVPDLIVLDTTGRTFFVEVKHPNGKGKLSRLQDITINHIRKQGADVYVIDNIEQARAIVERLNAGAS